MPKYTCDGIAVEENNSKVKTIRPTPSASPPKHI